MTCWLTVHALLPAAQWVLISVPGGYAAGVARGAMLAGRWRRASGRRRRVRW
ncbi:hypothetical protein [Caldilinea sp.]|uniref:hypothetical protein n=1 Tax=Caldilinea sp. TaxID=2293560 RepID=UPI002C63685B|nr:hypothetical protein [Anaerolineales bacterium]HQY94803.1 hypothetical protein [Caldilinea sp.]HRA67354.1 hypothetical protein [Caldilinea sp.]